MPVDFTATTNGGSGPISYREAVTTFPTKEEFNQRFDDMKGVVVGRIDDHEMRLRAAEAQRVPTWVVAFILACLPFAVHYLVPH